ncbi:MAG: hypothetical protein LBR08_00600 [Bacteroidales bacterium]|jgi:hypothetical protein|nr:hypothetical protein [Bacteroidales bacterium]
MRPLSLFPFLLLCLSATVCQRRHNPPPPSGETATVLPEAAPAQPVDTAPRVIRQIIAEELNARGVAGAIEEETPAPGSNVTVYRCVFENDTYTTFRFRIHSFDSERSEKREMARLHAEKQNAEDDPPIFITWYYFRIYSLIYSFYCTANLYHIAEQVYRRMTAKWNIGEEDMEAI